jgi:hypothetical protein
LLYAVLISLPLTLLRGIYGAVSIFQSNSEFASSLAVNVCLSVLPQLLIAVVFVVVGLMTRNINVEKPTSMLLEEQVSRPRRK